MGGELDLGGELVTHPLLPTARDVLRGFLQHGSDPHVLAIGAIVGMLTAKEDEVRARVVAILEPRLDGAMTIKDAVANAAVCTQILAALIHMRDSEIETGARDS